MSWERARTFLLPCILNDARARRFIDGLSVVRRSREVSVSRYFGLGLCPVV